jgi:hypothetical protein
MYHKIIDFFENIRWWFVHRLHPKKKYHLVDTKLKPGYYDKDKLMLHANFSLLQDFVEIECAALYNIMEDKPKKLHPGSAGLMHIDEMIELYQNMKSGTKKFRQDRIKMYETMKSLYLWWMIERPNRVDPYENFSEFVRFENGKLTYSDDKSKQNIDAAGKLEAQYEKEDTEKLIALMRIRPYLWT